MSFSRELTALGNYLAGEFDNKAQALAQPAWFVHLNLWLRPVPIFTEDSLVLYAEQISVAGSPRPYRPRILRLRQDSQIKIEYYMFKDIEWVVGAGADPSKLQQITTEKLEFLPNCTLDVAVENITPGSYRFRTNPTLDTPCTFCYQGSEFQVFLGLEATPQELLTFDKGIDPQTGKAIWGALLDAYRFNKVKDFSPEFIS